MNSRAGIGAKMANPPLLHRDSLLAGFFFFFSQRTRSREDRRAKLRAKNLPQHFTGEMHETPSASDTGDDTPYPWPAKSAGEPSNAISICSRIQVPTLELSD